MKKTLTLDFELDNLESYEADFLAALWHAAQWQQDQHKDPDVGAIAERIGREIIRRWLGHTSAPLWHVQGRSYYAHQLANFAHWNGNAWVAGPANPPAAPENL